VSDWTSIQLILLNSHSSLSCYTVFSLYERQYTYDHSVFDKFNDDLDGMGDLSINQFAVPS